jgi:putative transport protein
VQTQLAQRIATAYALTYVFGVLLEVWFLPTIGPRLMRVNLREASQQLEQSGAGAARKPSPAYPQFAFRAYRIPEHLEGRTVAEIESLCPEDRRVIITRLRRGAALLDAPLALGLHSGDVVAVAGRSRSLLDEAGALGWQEVDDRELLDMPVVSADLVLTNRELAGQSLRDLAHQIGARGVFLSSLRRGGRELPFAPSTSIERGDVLAVYGTRSEVRRVASQVGFVEYPTTATDLGLVGATIFAGGVLGVLSFAVGGTNMSLTTSVGVLAAGLVLGKLRTIHPRYGRVPEPAVSLFQTLGLSGFLALVGLQAGPGAVTAFQSLGIPLVVAGISITLLPHIVTILVGYYLVHVHPAVLLGVCAGAGISAPSLAALEKAADSRVPTLGYGVSCALGNALMALSGTVLVLTSQGR